MRISCCWQLSCGDCYNQQQMQLCVFRSKMGNISNESVQKSKPNMTQKKAICVIRSTDCLEFHLRNKGMNSSESSELHRSNSCFHVASEVTKPMESIRSEGLILRVLHNLHKRHGFKKIGHVSTRQRLITPCVCMCSMCISQYVPPVFLSLSTCSKCRADLTIRLGLRAGAQINIKPSLRL